MSIAIDQAFTNTILNGGLDIDVVHENGLYSEWNGSSYDHHSGPYVPEAESEFCELKAFPANTGPLSLADTDENVGIFQAILFYPADVAAHTIKTKAEAVLDLFVIGAKITYASQDVIIDAKTRDGGRIEGGYYQIVIRVNYTAYVSR